MIKSLLIAVVLAVVAALPGQARPVASGVRLGEQVQRTRFVLDINEKIKFRLFTLPDPYRVVIDLPEMNWRIPESQRRQSAGVIERYRYGLYRRGTSRIVLDLAGPAAIQRAFLLAPRGPYGYRLVIDLAKSSRKAFMAAINRPPRFKRANTPRPPLRATIKPTRGSKRLVVIDPGHGGIDPGANGGRRVIEKKITLAVGLELRRQLLQDKRYKVVMTRSRDIFIPLRERVAIGRRARGDLFISLHADSIGNARVRGATVYTLSETASDKEAAALARKENKADVIAGIDLDGESDEVTSILIDLAQRETMNYSAQLANFLVPQLGRRLRLRTNSHRFAGFRVLKAPDVPSVLIEMGYLSNRDDARFLTSSKGRRAIAEAVKRAIDQYFAKHEI